MTHTLSHIQYKTLLLSGQNRLLKQRNLAFFLKHCFEPANYHYREDSTNETSHINNGLFYSKNWVVLFK